MTYDIYRKGLKKRYQPLSDTEEAPALLMPFAGVTLKDSLKRQRHLPRLHMILPHTDQSIILWMLLAGGGTGTRPLNVWVRNNGNALASYPIVEVGVLELPFRVMGVVATGPIYPHQQAQLKVVWDWSHAPQFSSDQAKVDWVRNCVFLCYDPILDPRPDLINGGVQPPYHTKVTKFQDLPI